MVERVHLYKAMLISHFVVLKRGEIEVHLFPHRRMSVQPLDAPFYDDTLDQITILCLNLKLSYGNLEIWSISVSCSSKDSNFYQNI